MNIFLFCMQLFLSNHYFSKIYQRLENSFSAGDVGNIIRRIQDSLYKEEETGELVNLGGKVYIFPTVIIK